jgi:branched-chain amino acid transport system ATP-binding protein
MTVTTPNDDSMVTATGASVEIRDLSYSYGALRALERVTFNVQAGQVCCVLGPNGAGKSTLGAIVAGSILTTKGTIFFDGHDVGSEQLHRRARRGIAYVPEGGTVFPSLTVVENLALGSSAYSGKAQAELVERAAAFFAFLGLRRNARAGMLSGGEQRMLALARILIAEPKLAVIDELSHGLAPAIVQQLFQTLAEAKGSTTFILIEQYLGRAYQLADVILSLSQGSVAFWGKAADTSIEELEQLYRLHNAV